MRRPELNQRVQNTIDVLIVDPVAADATRTSTALRRRFRDISIVRVMHADQALRLMFDQGLFTIEPQLPRLILLDICALPDGKEFLTRITTDHRTRDIPVIALSKNGEPTVVAHTHSVGVAAHPVESVDQAEYESKLERSAGIWLDSATNQRTERHHKHAAMWA